MLRKTKAIALALGCCFPVPTMAQDDLMASAKQQFQPIPTTPPELPGNACVSGQSRTRQDAVFRPPAFGEPYDQLQLLS